MQFLAKSATVTPVLTTIKRFRDLPEALLAKGGLESAGIECFLVDDNMVRLWFISNLLGGVKLQVAAENVAEATEILNLPTPETLEIEGGGFYRQPHCPNCNSMDVSFQELNKPIDMRRPGSGCLCPFTGKPGNATRALSSGRIPGQM